MNECMPEIEIRKGMLSDADALERIYDAIHTEEEAGRLTIGWERGVYPTRTTAEAAVERGDLFVLLAGGRIEAGAIINHIQPDGYEKGEWQYAAARDQVMVLHTLAVDPSSAGKGYGTRFVAFYEEYAREEGCPYLRMDTGENNARARALYQKLGYREIGIVPTVFNGIEGTSLVLLEKKAGSV